MVSLNTSTYLMNDTAKSVPLQESVLAERRRKSFMDSKPYRFLLHYWCSYTFATAFYTRLNHHLFCDVVKSIAKGIGWK